MGWLVTCTDDDGEPIKYYAVYRDLQGRQRSAGVFTNETRAITAWQRAEAEQDLGKRAGDPKRGRMRLRKYVEDEWFPHHVIEASTREQYSYLLNRYILGEFGYQRMREIMPSHVRSWVLKLQGQGVRPPTIRACKVILDAVFTTALNDQIVSLHPGKGVKTPPVVRKPQRIITSAQFDLIHGALPDDTMRLLVETDIESGLRWGELTELRVKDLDVATGIVTVSRAVVHLKSKDRPDDSKFVVKKYPKDKEWRLVGLDRHLVTKLVAHIAQWGLGPEDLLFEMAQPTEPRRRVRPAALPDPDTLGLTEPNAKGRQYRHGTLTAYQAAKCRCRHCKDAIAAYRAGRRAKGKDEPRPARTVTTDGHIPNDWFRRNVWAKALETANLGFSMTPHGLRHAHASWLLAGGADLQVVKERLGHGSIATTEKYLHTLPGAHEAAITALTAIRGDRSPAVPTEPEDVSGSSTRQSEPQAVKIATPRAEELAEMRDMVARLSAMLGPGTPPAAQQS